MTEIENILQRKGWSVIKIKNRVLKGLYQLAAVTLSAQIGTIPFTLYFFGKLSLTSIAANLFVIPF